MAGLIFYHEPVLLREVLSLFESASDVLDCTLGGGGHAEALLQQGTRVVGVDRDPEAIRTASERLSQYPGFRAVHGNYSDIDKMPSLELMNFDGILADLGVSSRQLDEPSRGFSFREDTLLDMRMGEEAKTTAAHLLNEWKEDDIARILKEYGDEPRARRIAHEIVRRRARKPFETSNDLVGAIRAVLGARSGDSDFARLFQAVRIAVNDELRGLERALPLLRDRLRTGGVMAIISYHSGEDRIVKHVMREWSAQCSCPPRQFNCTCRGKALGELISRKAITAGSEEISRNPRSRSARLRAWRKTGAVSGVMEGVVCA